MFIDCNGNTTFTHGNTVAFIDKNPEYIANIKNELVSTVKKVSAAYFLGTKEITLLYKCNEVVDLLTFTEVKSDFSINYRAIMNYYCQFINIKFININKPDKCYILTYDFSKNTLWN